MTLSADYAQLKSPSKKFKGIFSLKQIFLFLIKNIKKNFLFLHFFLYKREFIKKMLNKYK